jgi:hypothetical protein
LSKTKYTLSKENDSCWCIEKKIYGCCLFWWIAAISQEAYSDSNDQ